MKLLGISGYARTGKDTFFNTVSLFNPLYKRVAFADLLKEQTADYVKEKFGLDVFSQVTEEKNIFRPYLIEFGAAKRAEDSDYWLNAGLYKAEQIIKDGFIPVVTDVRYENEARAILDEGGIVVSIHRNGYEPAHEEERKSIDAVLNIEHNSIFDYEWDCDFYAADGSLLVDYVELKSVNDFLERCIRDSKITS